MAKVEDLGYKIIYSLTWYISVFVMQNDNRYMANLSNS